MRLCLSVRESFVLSRTSARGMNPSRSVKVSVHVRIVTSGGITRRLWRARQRAVRKFSADKLARIVRIILQGLPVLTAAGCLSWHNLFLSIPRHPPLFLFFLSLSLFTLLLPSPSSFLSLHFFFPLLPPFFPSRGASASASTRASLSRRLDPRGTGKEREAGRMRVPMVGIT